MTKTILITGGSRGIGAATAIAAGKKGWNVVLTYHSDANAAAEVVEEIATAGGKSCAVASDVSVESDVISVFKKCEETFGGLDGLVNNAGILPEVGRLETFDLERWNRTFAVNTTGTFLCCREAIKMMSPRQSGSIVNVSSMAAVLGAAREFIDYGASKGAVDTLTIGLAKELGPVGIRVNGVRPGLIDTDIHKSAGDATRVERLASGVPMGRAGTAHETAEAIIWLLSDAASYVTGTFIAVSGGR